MSAVLVIGAGPSGLAVSAELARLGRRVRLVDRRGQLGGAYARMDPEIVLSSPARFVHLPGLRHTHAGAYISAGRVQRYLERYADHFGLRPERGVVAEVSAGSPLEVRFASGEVSRHEAVVAATGMFDFPRRYDAPGLASSGVEVMDARDWRGPLSTTARRILVVGGATAAVEVAESCGRAGVPVTVSARSGVKLTRQRVLGRDLHDIFFPVLRWLPRALARGFCERAPTQPAIDLGFSRMRRAGLIEVRGAVARFEGRRACFEAGPPMEDVELVVAAIGYDFAMPFLPPEAERAAGGHVRSRRNAVAGVPGLYALGTPCARGVLSEFFAGIAEDAPRVAEQIHASLPS